jgi:hypothetical protein
MRLVPAWFLLCAALVFQPAAYAVEQTKPIDFKQAATEVNMAAQQPVIYTDANGATLPAELYKTDVTDYARSLQWQRQFVEKTWEWHLFSTKLLFCIVLMIVGFGLWVTFAQFQRDYGVREKKRDKPDNPMPDGTATAPAPGPTNSMKIGPAGLEVTSQVIGLLVLGFSLAFFYLNVKEVYPMQEVELKRNADESQNKVVKTPARAASE